MIERVNYTILDIDAKPQNREQRFVDSELEKLSGELITYIVKPLNSKNFRLFHKSGFRVNLLDWSFIVQPMAEKLFSLVNYVDIFLHTLEQL